MPYTAEDVEKELQHVADGKPPETLHAILILFAKALLILLRRSRAN